MSLFCSGSLFQTLRLSRRQSRILTRGLSGVLKRSGRTIFQPSALAIFGNAVRIQVRGCFHPGASTLVPLTFVGGKQVSNWKLIKLMLRDVWPKDNWAIRRKVIFAMCLLVSAKILNVTVPFLLKDVINYYNGKAPEFLQLGLDSPVQTILTAGFAIIIAYGVARAGASGFNELRNAVFSKVAQHSVRSIARNIFLHLHSLDLSFHLSRQTGGLAKATDRGTRGMAFVMGALVFNVVPTILEVSMVTGIFYAKCGPEFAVATLTALSAYTAATLSITKWRTKFRHQMNAADNEAGTRAVDSLINYETVKYFNNEKFEADRYDHYLKQYETAALKTASSLALLNFTQSAIFNCGLVGIMCLAANNIVNGSMNVGDLVMANTLLFQLSIPLNFLGSVYREINQGMIDMQLMYSLLSLKSNIVEKPNAPALNVTPETSSVSFRNIHFGYIKGQYILQGLSLDIPAGKKVAIVGGSGSGKSTLVRLLYRLFDAESGEIFINGQKTTDVSLDSLRRSIAVVPQDSVLFHDTIYYNLQYGNPKATKEEVFRIAKMADLHDSVLSFKDGYNTLVGERGLKLSGGEKQRVAIARAILKDAPIIVYDEATSSLDALTEESIMNSMRSAVQKKTSLFIAHRLATIVDADIIYVLEKGKVIEKGDHVSLLNTPGSRYADLWRSQHKYADGVPPRTNHEPYYDPRTEELDFSDSGCKGCGCNR
ncbi:hypothetical protein AB6A40_005608 [Gnathostoma spinigerum]|uniref:Iron-sulfur clusters transporter ABCB7, mitochondrial n=1 Tax=Gnathostoma spinigerum TaxID=75299 RepID=A0ABD6EFX3_9BILA